MMAKNGYKCFLIVEIFELSKKSGSLNSGVDYCGRKLRNSCFCATAVKYDRKLSKALWNRQLRTTVTKRFRIGSAASVVSAHAQRKMAKTAVDLNVLRSSFAIMQIFDRTGNGAMGVAESPTKAFAGFCMRSSLKYGQKATKKVKAKASMYLTTTVTTNFE